MLSEVDDIEEMAIEPSRVDGSVRRIRAGRRRVTNKMLRKKPLWRRQLGPSTLNGRGRVDREEET